MLLFAAVTSLRAEEPQRLYELRTYHAAPGKLAALHARFRDHTCGLFSRHGMTNVGYWVPKENPGNLLIYLLSYPDKETRGKSWAAFEADPEWKKAKLDSEKDGVLVAKIESRFLLPTDFSKRGDAGGLAATPGTPKEFNPKGNSLDGSASAKEMPVFELRTYTTTPGNLPQLLKRFREHTVKLFERHGMTNFMYFTPVPEDPGAANTLVYLLRHQSAEAGKRSFEAFRADPEWISVKAASEKAAGGSLTVPDGVKSLILTVTDYSPAR